MTEIDWLKHLDLKHATSDGIIPWFERGVIQEMGRNGEAIYNARRWGRPVDESELFEKAISIGDPLMVPLDLEQDIYPSHEYTDDNMLIVRIEDGLVILCRGFSGTWNLRVLTTSRESCQAAVDLLDPLLIRHRRSEGGNLRMLVKRMGELSTGYGEDIGCPLERSNYPDEVSAGFDAVLKNFASFHPIGRLVLLEGPPGTGKSYLIRGLVNAADFCTFIYVPSSLVGSVSGPEILQTLSELKYDYQFNRQHGGENGSASPPIVLVLEDADVGIIRRAGDNHALVSDLLNLADGIPGEALNIRILASTNADRLEIDEAITRPGRLATRIQLPHLSPSHAQRVYDRLTDGVGSARFTSPATIAEIYAFATSGDAPEQPQGKIGLPGFGI